MKKTRIFVLLAVAVLLVTAAKAQTNLSKLMRDRGEYYFSLDIQQLSDVQFINSICSVDKVDGNTVICYANQKQFENLTKQGFSPTLLLPPSMQNEIKMWDGRGTFDWDTYPTYGQYEAMMQQFANDYPEKCTYMELGTLASGRKIMICRLNNGVTAGKPRILLTSTMHGDEVTGMILQLRLIEYLLTSDDAQVQNIMNNLDIFISPCTNPDGTYHGGNNTVNGATRYNAAYVDLNRHFPDFDDGPHPDGESYYQNETVWMMDLAQEYLFTMGANYHGGAEVLNYPWDTYQPACADDAWWKYVCHEYANQTHTVNPSYMTDYDNGITNGYAWYTITGSRQDYMNYYAQCREVTIECSNNKTPSASQLPNFWNYNKASMLNFMEEALNGIHGVVTDSLTGQPIQGVLVTVENHDHHGASVTTHEVGDYHRPIKGGTYNVTYTASGYYPKTYTISVTDGQTTIQDVVLRAGEGIIPDFEASNTNLSLNGTTNFTDMTWGANLTNWEWTFEGATPGTSTQQNPTGIKYTEIGSYDVTLSVTNANGQTETITKHDYITVSESYNMHNGTITTCNAMFYDDGGSENNYSDNFTATLTFMPGSENAKLQVIFNTFSTESSYDKFYIYDGTSTSAPSLGTFSGSSGPGTVTATNADGALTFKFESDYSMNYSGWVASVKCIFADPLEITVSAESEEIAYGESTQLSVTATGGSGNYTFSWEPAETLDDPTVANPVATPTDHTTYKVTVSDGNSTVEGEVTITITDLSVEDNVTTDVNIYPNPTSSIIYVECENQCSYVVFNNVGQEIGSGIFKGKAQLNIGDFGKGVYYLRITDGVSSRTHKVVVQ